MTLSDYGSDTTPMVTYTLKHPCNPVCTLFAIYFGENIFGENIFGEINFGEISAIHRKSTEINQLKIFGVKNFRFGTIISHQNLSLVMYFIIIQVKIEIN